MTKQEIVSETVEFYHKIRQKIEQLQVVLAVIMVIMARIAFGRCMPPEYKNQGDNLKGNKGTLSEIYQCY
jgi:hypothetical protein